MCQTTPKPLQVNFEYFTALALLLFVTWSGAERRELLILAEFYCETRYYHQEYIISRLFCNVCIKPYSSFLQTLTRKTQGRGRRLHHLMWWRRRWSNELKYKPLCNVRIEDYRDQEPCLQQWGHCTRLPLLIIWIPAPRPASCMKNIMNIAVKSFNCSAHWWRWQ